MAYTDVQCWVEEATYAGASPPILDCTSMCIARIDSDGGAVSQLIISRSCATDDGIALYYDNGSDQSSVLWFLDLGGGGLDQAVFGTRIPLNTWCMFAWVSGASNVTGYYLNLESPSATMQSATTAAAISGQGATTHMSVSSNANGAEQTVQLWRVWEGQLTPEELRTEAFSRWAVRRTGLRWDVPFDESNLAGPWADYSGNGFNASTQSTDAAAVVENFNGLSDVAHEWGAAEFIGATTAHSTSGALTSDAATVSGSAVSPHLSSGALAAQDAVVAGSSVHLTLHPTSGALSAQDATVSGSASRGAVHGGSGTLSADAAVVAGSAVHLTLHATTGALAAQAAQASGASLHPHTSTGALSAQSATAAGSAAHLLLHATSGALSAQAATVAGSAVSPHLSSGALAADAAVVAGSAAHLAIHASSGALASQAATVAGAADTAEDGTHDGSGDVAAQAAAVAGSANHLTLHATTGTLAAQSASASGSAAHLAIHATTGNLSAQAAAVVGAATRFALHVTSGDLVASAASLSGDALGPGEILVYADIPAVISGANTATSRPPQVASRSRPEQVSRTRRNWPWA